MSANFFMYDFETLATSPDALILNIAMLCGRFEDWFNTTGSNYESVKTALRLAIKEVDGRYVANERMVYVIRRAIENMRKDVALFAFTQEDQIELGSNIDDSTLKFWADNKEAYIRTYENVEPKHPIKDFYKLTQGYLVEKGYVNSRSGTPVWIRAPHFDDPIFKNVCQAITGMERVMPYDVFAVRDVRTIVDAAWGKHTKRTGYVDIYVEGTEDLLMDQFGFIRHDSIDDICRDTIFTFLSLNKLELV